MITSRDLEILRLINRYRFLGVREIAKIFSSVRGDGSKLAWENKQEKNRPISEHSVYTRMAELNKNNTVRYSRVLYGEPGVYFVNPFGVELSGGNLPAINEINLTGFQHGLACARCSAYLLEKYGGYWKTERELFRTVFLDANKKVSEANKVKIPDGILTLPNGDKIAVEVELSLKKTARLCELIDTYVGKIQDRQYRMVLYFASRESIKSKLTQIINERGITNMIQVHLMKGW